MVVDVVFKKRFESLAREAVKKAVDELMPELEMRVQTMKREISEVKTQLEATYEMLNKIRTVTLKPPYVYTPEYLIYESKEWANLVDFAKDYYNAEYGGSWYSEIIYGAPPPYVETEISNNVQTFTPKEGTLLLIGGFKNKGCKGKYNIIVADRHYATFYINKEETAIILPKPTGLSPEKPLRILTVEGDTPNFEPIGAIITCR
jgi:hypothetical protein